MIQSIRLPVQVIGINPPPVGKRYTMLLIVGIIGFVAGVVIFVTTALGGIMFLPLSGLSQSEPDIDGFLLFLSGGCLLMLCSFVSIAIGLNRNKKPVEIVYVQE